MLGDVHKIRPSVEQEKERDKFSPFTSDIQQKPELEGILPDVGHIPSGHRQLDY